MGAVFVPYCGAAPVPGSESWNFDPTLLGCLAAFFVAGILVAGQFEQPRRNRTFFAAGWLVLAFVFVSPLCNISVALFSARAFQHMAVTIVAAPLLARGLLGSARTQAPLPGSIAASCAIAFTACFWFWHSPRAYDETLQNNFVYWTMHLTLFGAAFAFWSGVLRSPGLMAFSLLSAIGLQMSLLGALLTFARQPLYAAHAFTTTPWGLTSIQDQQLGGLLMWAPAGLLLVLYSALALGSFLNSIETTREPRSPGLAAVKH